MVADQWADGVTHVVCGVDKGAAKRTAKYVLGIQVHPLFSPLLSHFLSISCLWQRIPRVA